MLYRQYDQSWQRIHLSAAARVDPWSRCLDYSMSRTSVDDGDEQQVPSLSCLSTLATIYDRTHLATLAKNTGQRTRTNSRGRGCTHARPVACTCYKRKLSIFPFVQLLSKHRLLAWYTSPAMVHTCTHVRTYMYTCTYIHVHMYVRTVHCMNSGG